MLFREHLAFLEDEEGGAVVAYEHRPKNVGWGHVERVGFADGRVLQGARLSDSWRRLFYGNRALRPGCYQCPYTQTRRPGDLTIADFWGIEATELAEFRDELGVSLVLANTPRGEALLGGLALDARPAALADALPKNPLLTRPSTFSGSRSELWDAHGALGYKGMLCRLHYYPSAPRAFAGRAKRWVKRAIKGRS